jgi:hypothetical protein
VEGSLAGAGPSESRAILMGSSGDVQRADVFVRDCRWIAVNRCTFGVKSVCNEVQLAVSPDT